MRHAVLLPLLSLFALAGFATAGDAPKDPNDGVVTDPTKVEVWTTDKGTKYHTKDCASAKIKETLAEAIVDEDEPCSKCSPPVYDAAKVTVFASESGKKYHLFNCRFAKNQLSLKDALAKGLEACSTCKAPALWEKPKAADAKPAEPKAAEPKAGEPAPEKPKAKSEAK
ncbi:MAG: hypothetical protein AAB263_14045 [Planctomycetota bacterium]